MSTIELHHAVKKYGDAVAVDGVDLAVEKGTFVTLLGPSGCGKTTTLRAIAGLVKLDGGSVHIGGELMADAATNRHVPPERRRLGMVFQGYALWPHMTAAKNIAYPLRQQGQSRAAIRARVDQLLTLVGLSAMGHRQIHQLSGGQQQRVALARALAAASGTVLYDEPLSNLDARLRTEMRRELRAVHEREGTTSVFVTHDQEEALELSDVVVVMWGGKVVQMGSPESVYDAPETAFVARFLGFENVFPVHPTAAGSLASTSSASFSLGEDVNDPVIDLPAEFTETAGLAIKSEHLRVGTAVRPDTGPIVRGEVTARRYLGDRLRLLVRAGSTTLDVAVFRHTPAAESLPSLGERIDVQIPIQHIARLHSVADQDRADSPEPADINT